MLGTSYWDKLLLEDLTGKVATGSHCLEVSSSRGKGSSRKCSSGNGSEQGCHMLWRTLFKENMDGRMTTESWKMFS